MNNQKQTEMKITKLEEKTYQGKVTGHSVTLDDGTNGYLDDKGSDTVVVGDEVSCTIAVKQNKKGGNYNLLTLKRVTGGTPPPPPPQKDYTFKNNINPAQPKTIEEYKVNASIEAMRFVYDAFSNQRIDAPQIAEFQRRAVEILWTEIDEIFNKK